MKRTARRLAMRVAFAAFSVVLIAMAYLRGNYLFGWGGGVAYMVITAGMLGLFARSFVLTDKPSLIRPLVVGLLSLPIGFAMASPASLNSDVQIVIDRQAVDREARAELAAVLGSDPAYSNLSVSTRQLKVLNVTIRGSLDYRREIDQLRSRIAVECPILRYCPLHWDVMLRKSQERIEGPDSELFATEGP